MPNGKAHDDRYLTLIRFERHFFEHRIQIQATEQEKRRRCPSGTLGKAWGDSLFGLSSQAAFWCALSTAPLLLALLGMIGFIVPYYFPAGHDRPGQGPGRCCS